MGGGGGGIPSATINTGYTVSVTCITEFISQLSGENRNNCQKGCPLYRGTPILKTDVHYTGGQLYSKGVSIIQGDNCTQKGCPLYRGTTVQLHCVPGI